MLFQNREKKMKYINLNGTHAQKIYLGYYYYFAYVDSEYWGKVRIVD